MSKSSPPVPNYTEAAQAQGQAQLQNTELQTVANRPNVNTPQGSETWSMTPTWDPTTQSYVNDWTQNINLNPALQTAETAQQGTQAAQSQEAQSLLPLEKSEEGQGYGNITPIAGTPAATTTASTMPNATQFDQNAANAAESEFQTYNQPLFQQAHDQLDTQLRNQGLVPGDAAYNTAMQNLTNSQGMQTNEAEQQAILTGGQMGQEEAQTALAGQNQAYGQELSGAQYGEGASEAQLAEQMQEQGFTLNQIQSILSGNQVGIPTMPSFATSGVSTAPNLLGAAESQGQGNLDIFNAQQQQAASTEQGVGEIGAGALAAFF